MILLAGLVGALYAQLLWMLAAAISDRRELALGAHPTIAIAGCGLVSAIAAAGIPSSLSAAVSAALVGTIVCAVVDARTGYIFDALSLAVAVVAGSFALICGHFREGFIAAAVMGGLLLVLYAASGRRGIGLGDVKLASAMALGLGLQAALIAIGGAFVIGAGYAGILIAFRRAQRSDAIRFGPFIACGAVVGATTDLLGLRW